MVEPERKFDRLVKDPVLVLCGSLLVVIYVIGAYELLTVLLVAEKLFSRETFLLLQPVLFGIGLLALLPAVGIFWRFARKLGSDQVVVWLRRFHQHEPYRFPLPKYLTNTGASRFQTATIQDSKFKYSFLTGSTRSLLSMIGIQVLLVIPSFLIALFFVDSIFDWLKQEQDSGSVLWIITVLLIFLVVDWLLFAPISFLLIKKRGVVSLKNRSDLMRIEKWIKRVQNGIGHIMPGLKVFKCGDDYWMDAVTLLLSRCDAAIIDISDLNENMRWELGQCADQLDGNKLILAYAVPPDRYPDDPPSDLVNEIEALIGEIRLREVIFWPYPEPFVPVKEKLGIVSSDIDFDVAANLETALDMALEPEYRKNHVFRE